MIKYEKLIAIELEKYPTKCSMRVALRGIVNQDIWITVICGISMAGVFRPCNIKNDPRVRIMEDLA